MNNEEAKFILQAYRAGGQDAEDPQFAEALKQAQQDPELAAWFAQERNLDAVTSRKLKEFPVPSDLKTAILAGRKIVQPAHWWQSKIAWAAAASIALLLSFAAWWPGLNPSGLKAFRQEMAAKLTSGTYNLQMMEQDMARVRDYLAAHQGHADFVVPAGLAGVPAYGCQVFSWKGKKVTLICMRSDRAGFVHLFVIDQLDLAAPPPSGSPQFAQMGEWTTASWTAGNRSYLLAGRGGKSVLQTFL